MKTVKNTKLKKLEFDVLETLRIERKMLSKKNEEITPEELSFILKHAESGSPLGEFDYGLYLLLYEHNEKEAEKWWTKSFYHCNGFGLWKQSGIFAYLGDEYYEWSMRCLRRSAWHQFPIAKRMLKEMKEHPFKFPEA